MRAPVRLRSPDSFNSSIVSEAKLGRDLHQAARGACSTRLAASIYSTTSRRISDSVSMIGN
jgi:hypothetical protein